jgi:hypothetical protein
MKHLYLSILFVALTSICIGFAGGMIFQNIMTGLWYQFGRVENACIVLWLPFFVLAVWQFSKFKKWLHTIKYFNQIESIEVDSHL